MMGQRNGSLASAKKKTVEPWQVALVTKRAFVQDTAVQETSSSPLRNLDTPKENESVVPTWSFFSNIIRCPINEFSSDKTRYV